MKRMPSAVPPKLFSFTATNCFMVLSPDCWICELIAASAASSVAPERLVASLRSTTETLCCAPLASTAVIESVWSSPPERMAAKAKTSSSVPSAVLLAPPESTVVR